MTNFTWVAQEFPSEQVSELLTTAERHDGFPAISDQALLEARRGERDVLVVDGGLGVGIIGHGEIDVVVRPDSRGQGVGSAMFTQLLERAKSPDLRAWVHGGEHSGRAAAEHLLQRESFQPIRTLLRLELDGAALTHRPLSTHGLELTPYVEEDAAEIVRVNAAAFASHPEQGKLTLEGFLDITREPWFNANDLLVLRDGEVIAFTWIKTLHGDNGTETESELYVIGVHPDAAGRGYGTRLLEATLDRMAMHHPKRVTLYVEGDNEPALALYRRAGFTELQRSEQWARG